MRIENKKERLYFLIAGIASLVLLVKFFLFSNIFSFTPTSFIFFSFTLFGSILLMVISTLLTLFILKGFIIMADKENLNNLKKYIIILFVLILMISLVDIFFPYWNGSSGIHGFAIISVGEPQTPTTTSIVGGVTDYPSKYLNWILPGLEMFVLALYALLGIWILKLRRGFGSLVIYVSIMYIYPAVMLLLMGLMGLIIPNLDNTPTGFFLAVPFFIFLFITKVGGHICLFILFFKMAKKKEEKNV